MTMMQPERATSSKDSRHAVRHSYAATSGVAVSDWDAIRLAVKQAGIVGNLDWLKPPVVIEALACAHEACGRKKRKFSPHLGITHEVWGAHRIYRNCLENPALKEFIRQKNLSPVAVVVLWVFHDRLENLRQLAKDRKEDFDPAPVIRDMETRCTGLASPEIIDRYIVKFMTDDPRLRGKERRDAQRAKGCLDPLEEEFRTCDKTSQVAMDGIACRSGHMTPEVAATCLEQAEARTWVLSYPAAKSYEEAYKGAMHILQFKAELKKQRTLQNYRDSARTVAATAKKLMENRGRWLSSAISTAARAFIL